MDYYSIRTVLWTGTMFDEQLYTYDELIKVVCNYALGGQLESGFVTPAIIKWQHVTDAYLEEAHYPDGRIKSELVVTCDDYGELNYDQVTKLRRRAKNWFTSQPEAWPGQYNYLRQTNSLGHPVALRTVPVQAAISHRGDRPQRHTWINYKHGRVGHIHSATGRYRVTVLELKRELQKDYPLRHQNRKDRKHCEFFPAFDDAEYMTARRSSGWKETSRRHRHQYKVA